VRMEHFSLNCSLSEIFYPEIQNLGMKIFTLGEFRGKIGILKLNMVPAVRGSHGKSGKIKVRGCKS